MAAQPPSGESRRGIVTRIGVPPRALLDFGRGFNSCLIDSGSSGWLIRDSTSDSPPYPRIDALPSGELGRLLGNCGGATWYPEKEFTPEPYCDANTVSRVGSSAGALPTANSPTFPGIDALPPGAPPSSLLRGDSSPVGNWQPVRLRSDPAAGAWEHSPGPTSSIGRTAKGGRFLPRNARVPRSTPGQTPLLQR